MLETTSNDIKVLIADDSEIFRKGLAHILRHMGGVEVVGLAADGAEAVDMARLLAPDIVLMDIEMPGMDGVAATAEIAAWANCPRVIMLTAHRQKKLVFEAIRAGAVGYLPKITRAKDLVAAIRSVAAGEAVLASATTSQVLDEFRRQGARSWTQAPMDLTEGEMKVLVLVAQGKSNAEIAEELAVAVSTVSNRLRKIYQKLHVTSRTQATLVALQRGWAALETA